jgi:hypothetical protein
MDCQWIRRQWIRRQQFPKKQLDQDYFSYCEDELRKRRSLRQASHSHAHVLTSRSIQGEQRMDEQRPPQQGQGQVQIKADEKELQGQYSNLVMIHHNLEEFTLNFIYIFPNGAQGKLTGSMIVSPGHAKRIWRALGENIARYESQFGAIKESPAGSEPAPTVGFVQ